MTKVAIVSAYNNKIEMTRVFLDTMRQFWPKPAADGDGSDEIQPWMILVNGGGPEAIEHPFISHRIDLAENRGFCPTLNAGLAAVPADADYVFFVGNDSFPVDSDWLPRLIRLLEKSGAWMACPANDRPGMKAYRKLWKVKHRHYYEVDFFPSIAWLMRRERVQQIGLLDEGYIRTGMYADNDYCQRIRKAGGKIAVARWIMLRHLCSAEGKVLGTQPADMEVNCGYYESKWGPVEE
jgi:glycosyltransferase involved in cell wall biosynthesis